MTHFKSPTLASSKLFWLYTLKINMCSLNAQHKHYDILVVKAHPYSLSFCALSFYV